MEVYDSEKWREIVLLDMVPGEHLFIYFFLVLRGEYFGHKICGMHVLY